MKIVVLGTRGIPDIQGGVETHCQELYPRLVKLGCKVTLVTRKSYVKDIKNTEYEGVTLKHLFAPKKKSLEAIIHTFLGVLFAWKLKPDILHIHAIGPSLFAPFAKLLGLKVIVTNHGPDYDRQKWGRLAKKVLMLGEKMGTTYADKVVVISDIIKQIQEKKYKRLDCILIYNGVKLPQKSLSIDYITSLGLLPNHYVIAVGRFVKEKGFHDLIEVYKKINTDIKLVLVGDADHEDSYSVYLKDLAKKNNIVLTGFLKGEKLCQVFSHAKLFVMPSYHEGLPIALLEAMSYNIDVLVSNIPANLEMNLDADDYFEIGNEESFFQKLSHKCSQNKNRHFEAIISEKYNWNIIAKKTQEVYEKVVI